MRSEKQYEIVLSDIGRVDSDNIKYLVRLLDQDTKDQVLSVEAIMILSSNSFHFIGDDTEERLQRVGLDIYDLQEALEKRAYSISAESHGMKISRMDILNELALRYPWFDGNIIDIPTVSDHVCMLLDIGVTLSDITLSVNYAESDETGKKRVSIHADNISHIEDKVILEFNKAFDRLLTALQRGDEEEAKRLTGIKNDLFKKLELLCSKYAQWFYPVEGRA